MNDEIRDKIWLSAAAVCAAAAVFFYLQRRRPAFRYEPRSAVRSVVSETAPQPRPGAPPGTSVWHFEGPLESLPAGHALRIETTSPATVRWTTDGWNTVQDTRTLGVQGIHYADLDTRGLAPGTRVQFTFFWPEANRWEGEDFALRVTPGAGGLTRQADR